MKTPVGKPAGVFLFGEAVDVAIYSHPERDRETQSDARCRGAARLISFPRRHSGDFIQRNIAMSSSNIAVRLEHAATDALSHPPRIKVREAANDERMVKRAAPRLSFTNRKFVVRDQGMRLFRVR
jgi:hypothetical protein